MSSPRARSGFSLIEVMCAIVILGVGLVGLTEGIATALRSARETRLQTAAALCASGVMETVRAEGYIIDGAMEGECGPGLESYRWRQTISRTDLDGLHDVEVVVEDTRTGKAICELRTMLFEVPSTSLTRDRRSARESGNRSRDQESRR